MELQEVKFQHRGKTVEGTVAVPADLDEAISALGPKEVFECFKIGYMEHQKKRLRLKRVKKVLKLEISKLSDEQKEALKQMGISI